MTHFRDEAERQRAREAGRTVCENEGGAYWTEEKKRMVGERWDRLFDRLYPIVDAPEGWCYCDMDADTPDRDCPVHGESPTPPDFDAAVDDFEYKIRCETMDTERGMHGRFAVTPEQVDAARQRVRELYEAVVRERDEVASYPVPPDSGRARYPMTDIRRDFIHRALTHPGFVGDRDLFVDVARDLAAEIAAARAALLAAYQPPTPSQTPTAKELVEAMPAPTLDALMNAFEKFAGWLGEARRSGGSGNSQWNQLREGLTAARAALTDYVVRLEAERDAWRKDAGEWYERWDKECAMLLALRAEGEEMEIVGHRYHTDGRPTLTVAGLYGEQFQTGDRVRVVKAAE